MEYKTIIAMCKDRRTSGGLRQYDIAAKLNWPKGRISEFESGKGNYSFDKLVRVLDAYGLTISIA